MVRGLKYLMCCCVIGWCAAGCGRGNRLVEIGGTVTYDGQPVPKGTIEFVSSGNDRPSAVGQITAGQYSLRVIPGTMQVKIESLKVIGKRPYGRGGPKGPMVDVFEQTLPSRFNTDTELTCEVKSGVRTYDFALEKPPKR